jgi:raffinose/stachyose/melibiose transport system substrate-binding protein
MDEITDFAKLKALVEDMAAHKKELGIDAVFADLPLRADSADWLRHAASPAVYADVKDSDGPVAAAVRGMKDFAFSLGDRLRDAVDLILGNSVSGRKGLDSVSRADAQQEFAAGKTAFLYCDSDSFSALQKTEGNVLQKDKLHFLPLYLGADGEDANGLTVRVNRYLAVNDRASEAQKQAAVDFLEWLFSAEDGKRFVKENLGYASPLSTFRENELPDDPLRRDALQKLGKSGLSSVPDLSDAYPGGTLHTDVSSGLLAYTRGEKDWDDFVSDVKGMWNRAMEAAKAD